MVFKYPGDNVTVIVTIRNSSNIPYEFYVGLSIGKADVQWYNDYTDGLGEYVNLYLTPGQTGSIQRSLSMPNDVNATDVWITVKDPVTLATYASKIFTNELTLAQVAVEILSVDVN